MVNTPQADPKHEAEVNTVITAIVDVLNAQLAKGINRVSIANAMCNMLAVMLTEFNTAYQKQAFEAVVYTMIEHLGPGLDINDIPQVVERVREEVAAQHGWHQDALH